MTLEKYILEQNGNRFPSKEWVQNEIDYIDWDDIVDRPENYIFDVIDVYIIGSRAKGTHSEDSDVDIAVVIPELPIDSLKLSERYHEKYDNLEYNGYIIDLQFFYPNDPYLQKYKKIQMN